MSIIPYNFEPLVTDVNNCDYMEYKYKSKLIVTDWCSYGKYEKQINDRECVCCFELANIFKKCTNNACITENTLFSKIILDEDILKITRQYMISKTKKKTKKRKKAGSKTATFFSLFPCLVLPIFCVQFYEISSYK